MFSKIKRWLRGRLNKQKISTRPEPMVGKMHYAPLISDAVPLYEISFTKGYQGILLGEIQSEGSIQYKYIFAVYNLEKELCFAVASEENTMASLERNNSHFLGVFPGDGHRNFGADNKWAELENFTPAAIAITKEQLNIVEKLD
ncbi:Hypothetical protein PBC10988_20250 [Planctomycetales bacterium 10988]|nr:Hypothetical protein PBC10988_20250 [Planctomycetales bacterium 10988]